MAVHRFKAQETNEEAAANKKPKALVKKPVKKVATKETKKDRGVPRWQTPFRAFAGYFAGSWRELRQVRWPNRKQTWALTVAVIVFSLLLGVVIFLLDLGFSYLFKTFVF